MVCPNCEHDRWWKIGNDLYKSKHGRWWMVGSIIYQCRVCRAIFETDCMGKLQLIKRGVENDMS